MLREYFYRTMVIARQLFNPKFLTQDQIVEDVLAQLTEADRVLLKYTPKEGLICLHMTMGMWIRNTYFLWASEYPYLKGKHPDDFSMEVIERVWNRLRGD